METRLVPLRWRRPAHSNTLGLMCSLECPQRKTTKIYCPVIEGATHSTFQRHPAATATNIRRAAVDLVAPRWCKNLVQRCFREGTGNDVRKFVADYRKRELTLELHFPVVRSCGLSLSFLRLSVWLISDRLLCVAIEYWCL